MARSSILYQAMTAVQTTIKALNLDGLDSDCVVLQKVAVQRDELVLPAVVIAPGPSIPQGRGTNVRDDWQRSVLVAIFQADNQDHADSNEDLDRYLLWQEQIEHAFVSQPLTMASTTYGNVLECSIAPHNNLEFLHFKNNLLVTAFFVQVKTRETRT
jgi:hypothetical protein